MTKLAVVQSVKSADKISGARVCKELKMVSCGGRTNVSRVFVAIYHIQCIVMLCNMHCSAKCSFFVCCVSYIHCAILWCARVG